MSLLFHFTYNLISLYESWSALKLTVAARKAWMIQYIIKYDKYEYHVIVAGIGHLVGFQLL